MDAKAILKVLCSRASKIAKRNGFDIDVASDLQLKVHYDLPESKDPRHALIFWWLVSKNNLQPYEVVTIYSVSGSKIITKQASKDGKLTISTSLLTQSVYIIKTNSRTIKYTK